MEDRWEPAVAASFDGPVAQCVYCSRLIGSDPDLVLHGGGNSSVKHPRTDVGGRAVDAIWVKGSGWDMATIEPAGFAPLELARVRSLLELDRLSDPDMMSELAAARLDPTAPNPSVESLLHAYLPHPAVQHSHADVIINLTNLPDGDAVVAEVFGDSVVVVPYVMPGFDLARAVRELWPEQALDTTVGMVLMQHGLFTFGDDSETAYRRHRELITAAETWLERNAPVPASTDGPDLGSADPLHLADLRQVVSRTAGAPMIMRRHDDPITARFVQRDDLVTLATQGPLTPDHVIRTKPVPQVGRDVAAFATAYRHYVNGHRHRARTEITELDPAPRIILDPELGMLAIGHTAADAQIAADIYHHTIPVLERAADHLGGYRALPPEDQFDMEYWDLEQAKLRRAGAPPELAGSVAFVTGAASGIGRACATELLSRGAAVTGVDRSDAVVDAFAGPAWLGVVGDVTMGEATGDALTATVERFGGIDILVVAAGIFGPSRPVAELQADEWRQVMAINVDSVAELFARAHPFLVRSPNGGRVVVIGSKNVAAPGMGAAAYSASKAALNQLTRIAALEWAPDGIRVNTVHPDAVFDTGLWTDELLAERAARYGLTVDEYRRRNLLGLEITSAQVARTAVALCTDAFGATTGAQVPVDGGNDRVV